MREASKTWGKKSPPMYITKQESSHFDYNQSKKKEIPKKTPTNMRLTYPQKH